RFLAYARAGSPAGAPAPVQGRHGRRDPVAARSARIQGGAPGLAPARAAPCRSGGPGMTCVLHISDTHFGTEFPDVVEALVALARDQAPELVVLGGDITQRARRGQFEAAGRFVARLPAPVLAVPGNHDIPLFNLLARWRAPYGGYRRIFGHDLEPVYESPGLLA